MTSIRMRLFVILLAASGVVWLSAVAWIHFSTRSKLEQVLDNRLQESARMVASLIRRQGGGLDALGVSEAMALVLPQSTLPQSTAEDPAGLVVSRQLSCQVWGLDGRLISDSEGAPLGRLADGRPGFSESQVDGVAWRVYSHVDLGLGVRVMVGDALSMRDQLVHRVVMGFLIPALLMLPLLAALIWWAVGRGLAPLQQLADGLSRRPASDLGALEDQAAAQELRPMIGALNGLFQRVAQARERERNFTAFAAHELKTPLAGIKTHAQIAALTPDKATRDHALAQIQRGVARTDRMARQLLDMTAVENAPDEVAGPQDGADLLAGVAADLAGLAGSREVSLHLWPMPEGADWLTWQGGLLAPALRNLIENAIQASARGGRVEIGMSVEGDRVIFRIADRGTGIADTDRSHVTDMFYRGSSNPAGVGSGLGLAIVSAVAARLKGELRLSSRPDGGEIAELILPSEGLG